AGTLPLPATVSKPTERFRSSSACAEISGGIAVSLAALAANGTRHKTTAPRRRPQLANCMSRDPWGSCRHSEVEYARSANAGYHDRHPIAYCALDPRGGVHFRSLYHGPQAWRTPAKTRGNRAWRDHQFLRHARNRLVCAIDCLAQAAPDGS